HVIADNILGIDEFERMLTKKEPLDECNAAALALKANLNESVDPCDDFYSYACGGWEASHTIPDDRLNVNNYNILDDNISEFFRESLTQTPFKSDSNAVTYASDFFKACIDEETRDARGMTTVIEALDSSGGWPILGRWGANRDKQFEWKDSLLNGNKTLGEDIADNGGLRESYRAFQTHVQTYGEPPRLPHVSQYSPQQLFFLSFASVRS
ncbi:unnamed protein product, partial [Oppiella nova]